MMCIILMLLINPGSTSEVLRIGCLAAPVVGEVLQMVLGQQKTGSGTQDHATIL
jgi:hypothetical protein